MQIIFQQPLMFRYIFSTLAKFVDMVHFELGTEGMRIRSIDPHDFCYVDLLMFKNFFKKYEFDGNSSFGVEISRLGKLLPKISSARQIGLSVNSDSLELTAFKGWNMNLQIGFLVRDRYDLPEPLKMNYDVSFIVAAEELSQLIKAASVVANEMIFLVEGKDFVVTSKSGDYSYRGTPSYVQEFEGSESKIETSVISSYLKSIGPLIARCDRVKVHIGEGLPIRLDLLYLDKAKFTFILSHKRRKSREGFYKSREGTSLPRLTISKLPEYLLYLSNCSDGEATKRLVAAGLETTGGDYGRMAIRLGVAKRRNRKMHITRDGESFVNLLQNNLRYSKQFMDKLARSKIDVYKVMLKCLEDKPLDTQEFFREINRKLKEIGKPTIDKQDLTTLLGLGIWCDIIDKKLALYYLGAKG